MSENKMLNMNKPMIGAKPYRWMSGHGVLFWLVLCLVALLAFFMYAFPAILDGGVIIYGVLWILTVIGFVLFIRQWSFSAKLNRRVDPLEIPIYLGITSVFLISIFGFAPYFDETYLYKLPSVSHLPSGLLLTSIGLFSTWLGYAVTSNSFKLGTPSQRKIPYENPSLSFALLTYSGVMILRLVLISLGSGEMILSDKVRIGGDWYQWLVYLIELRWFFIALFTIQVAKKNWPRRFLIIVLIVESAMSVVSGWSSLLLKIGILVIGCLMYTEQKLPWRKLFSMAVIAFAIVVFLTPVTRDLRTARRQSGTVTWANIEASIERTWGRGIDNGWELFSSLAIDRQSVIAQTPSILMNSIPSTFPFLPWQDLAVAPLTFIPRVFWPSKPVYTNVESWLTVQVFGGVEGSGSSAVTMAGNAYMYGGWVVVIIGMFATGVLAGLMYRWLAVPGFLQNQVGLLAVYAGVVIANFHIGEGDFISQFQGITQRIVVFLVVATVLGLGTRRKSDPL